jgi:hypothetical protein
LIGTLQHSDGRGWKGKTENFEEFGKYAFL